MTKHFFFNLVVVFTINFLMPFNSYAYSPSGVEWLPSGVEWLPSGVECLPSGVEWLPSGVEWLPSGVEVKMCNNSIFIKNIGLKIQKPNQPIETAYFGGWMPFTSKTITLPEGTLVSYIGNKDVPIVMGGNFDVPATLIVTVRKADEGRTFKLWPLVKTTTLKKTGTVIVPAKGTTKIWENTKHESFAVTLSNLSTLNSCEIYILKKRSKKWFSPSFFPHSDLKIYVPTNGALLLENFSNEDITITYVID